MALRFPAALRNARADQITSRAGTSAMLRIYDGTIPANADAAVGSAGTNNVLAELTCSATFAPAASGGVLTLNSITQDSSANNTGTASWFRITQGATVVMDGTVGTSGADLNLVTTSITSGQPVQITSFVVTEGNA